MSLSRERLGHLHNVMAGYVERGEAPGLVTAVSRRGETHIDTIGAIAFDGPPMRRDTIFRIASMTKPIVAVATLMLVEAGQLRLDDSVERWLPELANRRVLKRLDGPLDDTVPAHRQITVRDLLTFRFGFGMTMSHGESPRMRAERDLELMTQRGPKPAPPLDADEWLRRFATLPLMHQPGERWIYDTGATLLGILIPRTTGTSLEAFLREQIFEPLGMTDTGFTVPPEKLDRLATSYTPDNSGKLKLYDEPADSQWARSPKFPDAADGLVSAVDDYLAFGQMLLGKGSAGNQRLLSRLAVEVMTTDQLAPEQKIGTDDFLEGLGWGFGVSIVTQRNQIFAVPGQFGWAGGLGTLWTSDPTEEMITLLLTQRGYHAPLFHDFMNGAYQAIED
jgi:CubicO group peptidase (beta-lactamase class C family)